MGKRKYRERNATDEAKVSKLPRLPNGISIQKRPLLRPPIPSPASDRSNVKVVYISSSTPFLSAVNRVRKLLAQIQKRQMQSAFRKGKNARKPPRDAIQAAAEFKVDEDDAEPVVVKGTGRAIEKTMSVALFFLEKSEYRVEVRTGSVLAVDDLVVAPDQIRIDEEGDGAEKEETLEADLESMPESRLRYTSMVEAYIWIL